MPAIGTLPPNTALRLLDEVHEHVIVYRFDDPEDALSLRVMWANREVSPSGVDVPSLIGRRLVEVLPDLAETTVPYAYLACVQNQERIELPELHYQGRVFLVTAVPLEGSWVAGLIRDITASRSTEEHMQARVTQATEELRRTNAELEAFASSVSHDLRAPLRALSGFSQYLAETQHGLDDEGRYLMTRIQGGATRMNALIDALLRLSRIQRHEMARRSVDLAAQMRELIAALEEQEPERTVRVDLPESIRVEADPELSRIVVTNLLRNAWKFTRGTPRARINVTLKDGLVRIKDNGVGFDPEYAEQLWKPFARLHSDDTFDGLGIGLAIVLRIVRRHGGHIEASGAPGRGATFAFRLNPESQDGANPAG
ncbi:MAG: hypothetical protein GY913_16275 [Proteobacteria bacterium]|nr:hypothetical protein [Pseudomonadota bacterium]MCP4918461.1 hypothetical protein [Pseudomonadota bacterium]